jgi:hypothetical protein
MHRRVSLSRARRAWLYSTIGLLTASGVAWLVGQHWLRVEGEFGPAPHPSAPWWLRLHGAAAMVFLVVLGTLLRDHVRAGWRLHRNRPSGAGLLGLCCWLTLSGYGLYYIGGETSRLWLSRLHWLPGLLWPGVLIVHIWLGRRGRTKPRV